LNAQCPSEFVIPGLGIAGMRRNRRWIEVAEPRFCFAQVRASARSIIDGVKGRGRNPFKLGWLLLISVDGLLTLLRSVSIRGEMFDGPHRTRLLPCHRMFSSYIGYMFWKILLAFAFLPLLELALLLELGRLVGLGPTILLVMGTALLGAALARSQGMGVIRRIRGQLSQGNIPTEGLLDGAFVLSGGLLLLTPGLLTDLMGFVFLIPFTRSPLKRWLKRRLERLIQKNAVHTSYHID